jgi:hypothetical protein
MNVIEVSAAQKQMESPVLSRSRFCQMEMDCLQLSVLEFQTKFLPEFRPVNSFFLDFPSSQHLHLLLSCLHTLKSVVPDLAGSSFSVRK